MAKLPDYTQIAGGAPLPREGGGGVASYGIPSGLEAPGVATMNMGKQIVGIGEEIAREQEKIDTTAAEDAWNQYKMSALDLTVGPDGVLTKQAGDAVNGNLLGRVTTTLEQNRAAVVAQLKSPEQVRRFNQRADLTDLQTKGQTLNHMMVEQRNWDKTVFQGSESAARAQVTATPLDDEVFYAAQASVLGQSNAYLKANGITDANAVKAFKQKVSDSLWTTRIETLLYRQPLKADNMLRTHWEEIHDPMVRLQLQAKVKEPAMAVRAAMDADELIQQVRDIPRTAQVTLKGMTKDKAMEMVKVALDKNPGDYEALETQYILESQEGSGIPGIPNSREIAAQLPLVLSKVEKRADALYGADRTNPDRLAYVNKLELQIKSRISNDVQQMNAVQREAQGTLITAIMGGEPAGGMTKVGGDGQAPARAKVTSLDQILGDQKLARAWVNTDPATRVSLENLMGRNLNAEDRGDPRFFREMFLRIHQDPGTPGKIDFERQIIAPDVANRLSMAQINALRGELNRPDNGLMALRKNIEPAVARKLNTMDMFAGTPMAQGTSALMAWNEAVGKKIDEYSKLPNGAEMVRKMFQLDTPESVVKDDYLRSFYATAPGATVKDGAGAVKAGAQPALANIAQAPATITTGAQAAEWVKTLPPTVTHFKDAAGNVRAVPGRAPAPAQAATPDVKDLAAPMPAAAGKRPDGTAKGQGFFGPLKIETGAVVTEYSVGVKIDGKQMDIPTLVPTLTRPEIDQVLHAAARGDDVPEPIVQKAADFAKQRIAAGKSVFAGPGEVVTQAKPVETMNEQGKINPPAAAPAEIKMPTLVITPTVDEKKAARFAAAKTQADKDATITKGVGVALTTGAIDKAAEIVAPPIRAAGEKVKAVAGAVIDALSPDDAARAVNSFRGMITSGQYTLASEPLILDAMSTGTLTPAETRAAAAMLRAISAARAK